MLGITRVGFQIPGATVGSITTVYKVDIFNALDELALYKSLARRPNESNIILRRRIVNAKNFGATSQGLVNWLSDSFDLTRYTVADKRIYNSVYAPLSYMEYNKLVLDNKPEYFEPEVIADGITYKFPIDDLDIPNSPDNPVEFEGVDELGNPLKYSYSFEKTIIWDTTFTKYWVLWKNIDQTYFTLWETNSEPNELKLRYQYNDPEEGLIIIEESANKLGRNEFGEIIEEET